MKRIFAAALAIGALAAAPAQAATGEPDPCITPVTTCVDEAIDRAVDWAVHFYRNIGTWHPPSPDVKPVCEIVWEDGCP